MKKLNLLLILFIGFYSIANCQIMPTIREIYNFDINDEFQYRDYSSNNPFPNATRYVIIDKFYSSANDTVFYRRHFDNYTSTWESFPSGHLVYFFSSYDDTTYMTNLDTLVNASFANEINDSCNVSFDTLYNASDFCGVYSYEHYRCLGCCFEGQLTRLIYGIGIGLAYHYYSYPSEWYETRRTLFYYKKGAIECGEPDLLAVSINEQDIVNLTTLVYPNPASQVVYFNTGISKLNKVAIYNSLGKMVISINEYMDGPVNISSLDNGFYFVFIKNDLGTQTCKFVINRN